MSDGNAPYQTAFNARIVSVEEAVTKIVSTEYYGSSVASIYIPLVSPERRQALFRDGVQMQISWVEKYFRRPPELERMGILSFFSLYDVNADVQTNQEYIHSVENMYGEYGNRYLYPPNRINRPPNTLAADSHWEEINLNELSYPVNGRLFPDFNLLHAKSLAYFLRLKPQMILTNKFSVYSDIEDFCYAFILLNGSWRSDEEMKANQESWQKALEYHGLSLPENDDIYKYYCNLIEFMLDSPMYNENDFIRNISLMNFDMIPFINSIKEKLSLEKKIKCDSVINQLQMLYNYQENIVENIDEPIYDRTLNKYIKYSWSSEEINSAKERLESSTNLLNSEQKLYL